MLHNLRKRQREFAVDYSLNAETFSDHSMDGELEITFYNSEDSKFELLDYRSNLKVFTSSLIQDESLKDVGFMKTVRQVDNEIYEVTLDFSDSKDLIMAAKSSYFRLKDKLPTGFEFVDDRKYIFYGGCDEYYYVDGNNISAYLMRYKDTVKKIACELKMTYFIRPSFEGEFVVPQAMLQGSLVNLYSSSANLEVR